MHHLFAIPELVTLILLQTSPQALLNCQRVCRLWKDIIDDTEEIQRTLFLKPEPASTEVPRLNPILETHFSSLFGPCTTLEQYALRAPRCTYADLSKMPFARDGTHEDAPARLAFTRKEASWRNMLLFQPPLMRLDWYYEFENEKRNSPRGPVLAGSGYQRSKPAFFTLGMLYDFLESRLLRDCQIRVVYFPSGGSANDDPTASKKERMWEQRHEADKSLPRIRVDSSQVWPDEGSAMYSKYNVKEERWEIYDELPFEPKSDKHRRRLELEDGNGLRALERDCTNDGADENWRWSRSDAFDLSWYSMFGSVTFGGGGGRRSERLRARRGTKNVDIARLQSRGRS